MLRAGLGALRQRAGRRGRPGVSRGDPQADYPLLGTTLLVLGSIAALERNTEPCDATCSARPSA